MASSASTSAILRIGPASNFFICLKSRSDHATERDDVKEKIDYGTLSDAVAISEVVVSVVVDIGSGNSSTGFAMTWVLLFFDMATMVEKTLVIVPCAKGVSDRRGMSRLKEVGSSVNVLHGSGDSSTMVLIGLRMPTSILLRRLR